MLIESKVRIGIHTVFGQIKSFDFFFSTYADTHCCFDGKQ